LLATGDAVNAAPKKSEDPAATQAMLDTLVDAGKMDAATRDRLIELFADQSEVRVMVRVDATDKPFARLPGRKARPHTTRTKRRAAIAAVQDRMLGRRQMRSLRNSHRFRDVPFVAMQVDATQLETLAAYSEVIGITEDQLLRPSLQESGPHIGADVALSGGYGGAGQVVAVLDTGLDASHPALVGRVVAEACFSTASAASKTVSNCPNGDNPDGQDSQVGPGAGANCEGVTGCDHGTHVAGIVAGNDAVNRGIAPDADLIPVQVFSRMNDFLRCGFVASCNVAFTSDVIRGLEHIYDLRGTFDIAAVNMSLGGGNYASAAACDAANPSMKAAIDNLREVGIATVVASGNAGSTAAISMPACISSAVSVGATDVADVIAGFSSSADYLDVLAPGVDIDSAVPGGGFAEKSGTSMATPHVAGAWAALGSAAPEATPGEILDALTLTGVPITEPDNGLTFPRIQLDAALDFLTADRWDRLPVVAEPYLTGLTEPVWMTHAGDGSGRLFIVQRGGQILVDNGTSIFATPLLDLGASVPSSGSEGLSGLAFHPDYTTNGFLFVEYVDNAGDIVVDRYTISANPNVADPASRQEILRITLPAGGHVGGRMHFGTDGYLYLATGDGALDGTVTGTAGDLASLLGKILRIDVDGGTPYAIPPDNPFVGVAGAAPEIWALGVRNPRHFSFDPLTNELYVADAGESAAHEINVQEGNSPGGEDYGWNIMEGSACFANAACDPTGLTLPVAEYGFGEGCAVTGGSVYRGADYEDLHGVYVFGDLCSGTIWGMKSDEGVWTTAVLSDTPFEIVTFGADEAGRQYFADGASGDIYRLTVSDLAIDTAALGTGYVNIAFSKTLAASGGTPPYAWEVIEGVLPAGLTLDGASGVISGIPTATTADLFTVQVTDASFASTARTFRLFVNVLPLGIETTTLPRATTGAAYSQTLSALGGDPPYTWSITAGALPAGLTLDAGGTISGVATASGTFDFTATVTDALGATASQALSIAVELTLTVEVIDPGEYGKGFGTDAHADGLFANFTGTSDDLTLHVTGFDIDDPAGDEITVYLNGAFLGYLSNGPDAALNAGDAFSIPASLQQPGTNFIHFQQKVPGWVWGVTGLLLTTGPPPFAITTTSVPQGTYASSYATSFEARDGTAPYTWSLIGGVLPAGLVLGSDGQLTGIPLDQGSFPFTVQVSDADSVTAERAFTLDVAGTTGTEEAVLQLNVTNAGQYGWGYGADLHKPGLYATFLGTGGDLTLHVTGFDIDDPAGDEVAVYLNGTFLGYLSNGLDNGLNDGDAFALPASLQVSGPNLIYFEQKVPGWIWGVTNLLLVDGELPLAITTASVPDATLAAGYSTTLENAGGTAPFTWSVAGGALPAGLVLGGDGVISGIPDEQGSFPFTARVTDADNTSADRAFTLTVNGITGLVLQIGVTHTGQYGWGYGASENQSELDATFISTGDALTLHATGYDIDDPAGDEVAVFVNDSFLGYLSNGPDNGLSAGDSFTIPTSLQVPGANVLSFRQKVPGWIWGVTNLLLIDGALPLAITTASVPDATFAESYAATLEGTGGTAPYTWSIVGGALPTGLTLDASGEISGTPTTPGSFPFTARVTDADSVTADRPFTLTVNGTVGLLLQINVLDTGQYGYGYGASENQSELNATFISTGVDLTLQATGYDIDDPAGDEITVLLNGNFLGYLSNGPNNSLNAGDIFAIPASLQLSGANVITFKQKVPGWAWGVTDLLLTDGALPLSITTASFPNATFATSYSVDLQGAGGTAPYAWAVTDGALPAGLILDGSGEISGAPTVQGNFTFTVEVSDADGATAERTLTLDVVGTSGTVEVVLQIGIPDPGQYGYGYGTSQHQSGLYATFMGTGVDLTLNVTGYDIDDPAGDEVEVHLNGVFIGYLSNGPNNQPNAGDTFSITAAQQQAGPNLIYFKQKVPGWVWGVSGLLLTP
jgi:subtilisin family serine protease